MVIYYNVIQVHIRILELCFIKIYIHLFKVDIVSYSIKLFPVSFRIKVVEWKVYIK